MKVKALLICSLWVIVVLATNNLNSATITVINTNDAGPGSLRDAITQANNTAGADTIIFNIPGAGSHTILPNSQLPALIDPAGVLIDGLSQPGATTGGNPPATAVLMVEVNGTNAGAAYGFWILSPYNTIQGIVVNSFQGDGINVEAVPGGTYNNYIYCNFIGTDPTGSMAQGNGQDKTNLWAGVYIIVPLYRDATFSAFYNVIEANLISCNYAEGVGIVSCPPGDAYENLVIHNYIGTDVTGTVDLGNEHDGVYIGEKAHHNTVAINLISGNDFSGVGIVGYYDPDIQWRTHNNDVYDNIIGLDINLAPLPNSREGVCIGQYGTGQWGYAPDNTIGPGNIIAHNGRHGVMVWEHWSNTINADSNQVTQNSIYDNILLGIDLGNDDVTLNDTSDPDAGPNQVLNFPVITSAIYSGGQTTITGTIGIDTNPAQAVVEVFKARPDSTGYGEGEVYLGSTTPDVAGNWSVVVAVVVIGDEVTATTTDINLNTSEFCKNVAVTAPVGVMEESSTEKSVTHEISQNCPNPFNAETVISYQLPQTGRVVLNVYNFLGEHVRTLVEEKKRAGLYRVSWDGIDHLGKAVPSGVYFYRINVGSIISVRKAL